MPQDRASRLLFSSVQSLSCVWLCKLMDCSMPGACSCPSPTPGACSNSSPSSRWPSNHLILCCPLLPPSVYPRIRVFSNESALHIRWPKCWSFSFSISPSNDIQDWFPLGLTALISQAKGLSGIFSNTTVQKHQFFGAHLYGPTLTAIHDYWKNYSFD